VVVCLVVEQFVFPQLVGLWVVFGLLLFYNEIHFIFAKKKTCDGDKVNTNIH